MFRLDIVKNTMEVKKSKFELIAEIVTMTVLALILFFMAAFSFLTLNPHITIPLLTYLQINLIDVLNPGPSDREALKRHLEYVEWCYNYLILPLVGALGYVIEAPGLIFDALRGMIYK